MKATLALSLVTFLLLPTLSGARGKEPPPPSLSQEHTNPSKTVSLRTPEGWTVKTTDGQPEVTEARGDGLVVRILRREGELGLDSLHVECMLVRLRGAMDAFPQVDYEYDFVGGEIAQMRALDSAFVVHYDDPVEEHRDWRQRNLTVVGKGQSVCVIAHAPMPLWKKSKSARNLLTAVVESIRF